MFQTKFCVVLTGRLQGARSLFTIRQGSIERTTERAAAVRTGDLFLHLMIKSWNQRQTNIDLRDRKRYHLSKLADDIDSKDVVKDCREEWV